MYFILKNFWFTIHVDSWFWRIIDLVCWACAISHSIPNLQARTDRQTVELIRVELSNIQFLQVKETISNLSLLYTRCAWAGGTYYASFPDFCNNRQFHVIYWVTLAYVLFWKNFWFTIHVFLRIIYRVCWACAIFRPIPNLQACTDRRTDGRMDGRTDGRMDGRTN